MPDSVFAGCISDVKYSLRTEGQTGAKAFGTGRNHVCLPSGGARKCRGYPVFICYRCSHGVLQLF